MWHIFLLKINYIGGLYFFWRVMICTFISRLKDVSNVDLRVCTSDKCEYKYKYKYVCVCLSSLKNAFAIDY